MVTTIRNSGSGPGPRTLDGCSVEFWKQLRPGTEPQTIASAVPSGSTVLELGAGVGRITHPLLALGYRVTAVDNSMEMLAEIRGAETILSDIESLRLDGVAPGRIHAADGVVDYVDAVRREGPLVHMILRHETAIGSWTHSFTFEPRDREQIDAALAAADLRLDRFLDPERMWIVAAAR